MMRIYIDGCSLTYGQGLPRNKSIGNLFQTIGMHENVLDMSRPGKSNSAIVQDTWDNRTNFDAYILGFTYSSRTYLKVRDLNLDFHTLTEFGIEYQHYFDSNIEESCSILHKHLYALYDDDFYNKQSDVQVDTIISKLVSMNKIVVPFSWEKRKTDHNLLYPFYGPEFRISKKDHHLNEAGTKHLFDSLQLELLEKQKYV